MQMWIFLEFFDQLEQVLQVYAAIICHNDELSSRVTWLDCLQIYWEGFILLAESSQILLNFFLFSFS